MTHDLKGAPVASTNSFDAHGTLEVGEQSYEIYRLAAVEGSESLPYSLKVLLENLLRTDHHLWLRRALVVRLHYRMERLA